MSHENTGFLKRMQDEGVPDGIDRNAITGRSVPAPVYHDCPGLRENVYVDQAEYTRFAGPPEPAFTRKSMLKSSR